MNKKKLILIVIIEAVIVIGLLYRHRANLFGQEAAEKQSFDSGLPVCKGTDGNHKGEDHEVHSYKGFELCYRESYEVAEWVSYTLTRDNLNRVTGRSNDFRSDPLISTGSATPADYKSSGFDRGHLAPAADMEWSVESTSESFLMSNMTPQTPSFNRKIWMYLESEVRNFAERFGEVSVVTGPVLEKPASEYTAIGSNNVCVPEYFYKALLVKDNQGSFHCLGFIIPNYNWSGTFWDYAVSIDEIERRTGIDFFTALEDSIEEKIESSIETGFWK